MLIPKIQELYKKFTPNEVFKEYVTYTANNPEICYDTGKLIFRNTGWVSPQGYHNKFNVVSIKNKAFKPTAVKMWAITEENKPTHFDICELWIMGSPQFISVGGKTNFSARCSSLFFEEWAPVNWAAFGTKEVPVGGTCLHFIVKNNSDSNAKLFIAVMGNSVSENLISVREKGFRECGGY